MSGGGPLIRITGGRLRGRRLEGAAAGTRPATARLRESVFGQPRVLERCVGGRVLDTYAGAGLLGLEALSRGAVWVDFVERGRPACAVIQRNAERLGVADRCRVLCLPVERCRARLTPSYDLWFADPPYEQDASAALTALAASGVLAADGLLLWRTRAPQGGPAALGPLARVEVRRYGDGVVSLYGAAPEAGEEPG